MNKKNLIFTGILSLGLLFGACSDAKKDTPEPKKETKKSETDKKTAVPKAYSFKSGESMVKWKGYVAGIKEHTGTLNFVEAKVTMTGEKITGGTFEVDMTSMATTDSNYTEEKPSSGLLGHLASPDFFDIASFPNATFVINGNTGNSVKGDLTVRGVTKPAVVNNIVVEKTAKAYVVTGDLVFDRQEFGVAFSGGKDFIISDDIELGIKLTLK